jgi:F0F1-type ATP synthase assembly protein I
MPQPAREGEFSTMGLRGPSEKQQWALMARYGTVGIEMGLCVIFGWYMGITADEWFDSAPYGLNIGMMFGVAAAFNALWRMYKVMVSDSEKTQQTASEDETDH